jgi:hypothetical protein
MHLALYAQDPAVICGSRLAYALNFAAWLANDQGDFLHARALAEELAAISDAHEFGHLLPMGRILLGYFDALEGAARPNVQDRRERFFTAYRQDDSQDPGDGSTKEHDQPFPPDDYLTCAWADHHTMENGGQSSVCCAVTSASLAPNTGFVPEVPSAAHMLNPR